MSHNLRLSFSVFVMRWVFCASLLFLVSLRVFAQTISLSADSNKIQIGEHLKLQLSIKASSTPAVKFPLLRDTVGSMELLYSSKIDTAPVGSEQLYTQWLTVSAYDSGTYTAGPVPLIASSGDTIYSNTLEVFVTAPDVDTTQAFKDIKPPLSVPLTWREMLPWILLALGILLLLTGVWVWWKYFRKKTETKPERTKPKDPPHVWARRELKKLDEEKLWQREEVKEYYSRLSDILRLYLEYRYDYYAMEATTEQIADEADSIGLPFYAKEMLLENLRRADLVKFAKMNPLPDEHSRSMKNAFDMVEMTKPSDPASSETKTQPGV